MPAYSGMARRPAAFARALRDNAFTRIPERETMKATHWMQIAALTAAMGLTGTAMAQRVGQATGDDARSGVSANEAPLAGAIVTPEDKALGMGKHDVTTPSRNGTREDDASRANDDIRVNPGTSSDDMSVNPGPVRDDMNVDPRAPHDGTSGTPGGAAAPGSNVQPRDIGPRDMRGQ
jgi:hypothetical protein